MKKLFFSACMSVFALSLFALFMCAMEAPKEFERFGGKKRLCPLDGQQLVNIAQPHPLGLFALPEEMWGHIIIFELTREPTSLHNVLLVCKEWEAVTKSLPVPLYPWNACLTNTILGQFPNLTDLNLNYNKNITDESVKCLRNLTILKVYDTPHVTDSAIRFLTNLTSLDAGSRTITDESIKCLLNLTILEAHENPYITDSSIKLLTNLTDLDLKYNKNITDESVKCLSNLTSLKVCGTPQVTDSAIRFLTNLTSLGADSCKITDESVKCLRNLTSLESSENPHITDSSIKFLTNLTILTLILMDNITDEGMKPLIKLRCLELTDNSKMTGVFLQDFKDLTSLDLHGDEYITDENIKNLVSLTSLNLENNQKITSEGVMLLTNLRELKLVDSSITNDGISPLRKLTYLKIEYSDIITDKAISLLTNLTTLELKDSPEISWLGIRHLTNLTDWVKFKGGKKYGEDFVNYFEQDAPDFGMWDDEAVQAYAELIKEYPQFSSIMDEKENREALEKLFKEKGLDSSILKEAFQFQKDQLVQEQEESEDLSETGETDGQMEVDVNEQ